MSANRLALVINCGSSSVKYRLLNPVTGTVTAGGVVERIGSSAVPDHAAALDTILDGLAGREPSLRGVAAVVGHRVVHGGERFREPVLIDDAVLVAIEDLSVLAPLHNPANAAGIRVARARLPDLPQVAVFDTAFHATIPPAAATYAVPARWRQEFGVRRYGFQGTSHAYVSREVARFLGRPLTEVNTIVLHLGSGASACAVQGGRSIDTSMGLTPLQGLVMGTRSGDVDPALPGHLARVAGLSPQEVDLALNQQSGLLGLAAAADMREVTARAAAGDPDAELALEVYCYRVRGYVGAYLAALGRIDAIAFTAGVGENSSEVRARCLAGLDRLGVSVNGPRNSASGRGARRISPDGAPVAVLVVPTDEEREIATQALRVVS